MAITAIAHASAGGLTGGTTASINTTGANFIAISAAYASVTSVTDSKGNTYTGLTARTSSGAVNRLYYCENAVVGSGHTFTIAGSVASLSVGAFAAVLTSSSFDVQNGNVPASGVSCATGSITPSVVNELLIAGLMAAGTTSAETIDNGFVIYEFFRYAAGANYGSFLAYLVDAANSAINPTFSWTTSQSCAGTIASFKPATGATPTLFRQGDLNGLGATGPFFKDQLSG